jgi:asparagine synthase (glutamine-hydrolysing)
MYDEPFGDSSQIPTYLVSKLARKDVVVSLSGDGGDELFGGYPRYMSAQKNLKLIELCPTLVRGSLAGILRLLSSSFRSRRIADYLKAEDRVQFYRRTVSFCGKSEEIVSGARIAPTIFDDGKMPGLLSYEQEMMNYDMVTFLPDDILVKVDRASMSVSLEARVPFLDHRIVEFSMRLPLSMKIRDGRGKLILRDLLTRHIPKELVERPKMGFGIPLAAWLRKELRPWAEDLLSEDRLREEGFLRVKHVRSVWDTHLSGRENMSGLLWQFLAFQSWFQCQKKATPCAL